MSRLRVEEEEVEEERKAGLPGGKVLTNKSLKTYDILQKINLQPISGKNRFFRVIFELWAIFLLLFTIWQTWKGEWWWWGKRGREKI